MFPVFLYHHFVTLLHFFTFLISSYSFYPFLFEPLAQGQLKPFLSYPFRNSRLKIFFKIVVSQYSQENTCVVVSFLIRDSNFIKKRLQHWCFPMNIAKFLRTVFFLQNTSGGYRGSLRQHGPCCNKHAGELFKHSVELLIFS